MKQAITKTILCLLLVLSMTLGMIPALAATTTAGTVLYFENTGNWSNVKIYYWSDSSTSMTSWPGQNMTRVEGQIYSFTIPSDAKYVIFNNGSGTQTGDLPIPSDADLYNYGTSAWSTYVSACPHSWDEGTVSKAATCTENGIVTYTCTLCGVKQTGAQQATGHKFSGNVCTVCGEELLVIYFENTEDWSNVNIYFWSDSDTNMAPWPGNPMEKVEGNLYSLAINAAAQYVIFNNGSSQTGDLTIPEGKNYYNGEWSYYSTCNHNYDNGVITKEATCTTDGVKTYTCSLCKETKTETIKAAGHNYVGGTCTVCGATEPCTEHSWDDGVVTTAATCTTSGVMTYTCTKCKSTRTETIYSLGHDMVNGVCSRCGEEDTCSHRWFGGTTVAATCEKDGYTTETCLFCKGKKVTVIPAKGHKYAAGRCYVCGKEADHIDFIDISNAAELLAFAERVNAGENTLNARLTADIDLKGATWTSIGYYLKNGNDSLAYQGRFEGNGHTISNFTVAGNDSVGLIGYADMAVIQNLGVINATATGANAGAIVGYAATSTISNCFAKDCTITGYTTNPVALTSRRVYVGAIAGQGSGYVYNCLAINCKLVDNTGNMEIPAGETYRPWHEFYSTPVGGNNSSISNNFYYNVSGTFYSTTGATEVTAAQLASGEITYKLNKGVIDGTQAWYQTCGLGLPAFSGKTVYEVVNNDGSTSYTNTNAHVHDFVDGVCTTCGEKDPNYVPVVVPTITLKTPTLLLEDTIKLNIYYTIDQDIPLEKMGMITWKEKPSVVDISTADAVYPGATFNEGNGQYGVNTDGIPAQNLGDIIYFCIYAELADGSIAYGKQVQYSPTTYAYNQLKGGATPEMKALLVAILNYGAAAQVYLEDTDALVTSDMTDAMKALIEAYRSDMVHSVAMPSASKQGAMASNGGFGAKKPTIALEGAFSINYYFTPSKAVAGEMTFYYWNAADFEAAEVLTAENATGSYAMTEENGAYGAAIQGIAAKDIDSALYACGVYTDASGNTYSTGILPYSLGFYCGNQAKGEGALADLASAIAVYGYYAGIYFAK